MVFFSFFVLINFFEKNKLPILKEKTVRTDDITKLRKVKHRTIPKLTVEEKEKIINKTIVSTLFLFDQRNYNTDEKDALKKLKKAAELLEKLNYNELYENDIKSKYFLLKIYVLSGNYEKAKKLLNIIYSIKNPDEFEWNKTYINHVKNFSSKLKRNSEISLPNR
jgi:hypothetical protein